MVDDNRSIHEDFRKILSRSGNYAALDVAEANLLGAAAVALPVASEVFDVESAYQGEEGWEMVRASVAADNKYAMAFVDMRMPPGWDGVETITKMWEVDPEVQIVICTAYSDRSWEEIIRKLGHADRLLILKKPFDTIEVCQLACALTEKWELARRARLKLNQLRAMVHEHTRNLQAEIIERRKSEEELRQSQGRYALAIAGANDGIWDWDFTTQVVFYSSRWKAMLGATDSQITPTAEEWFSRIHPEDLGRMKRDLEAHNQGRSDQFYCEYRMMHSDGRYRWMLSRGVAVRDGEGKGLRAAGSQTDITDRKLAEAQLQHGALHDTLTGLPNRVLLMDRINQCLGRLKRAPEQRFAVIFLDLDRFKVINSLGHAAGDELLIELARRLDLSLRIGDTLSRRDADHLARLGGDELVALLEDIRMPADAVRVADRLRGATAQSFSIDGHEVFVSVSFGIALSYGDHSTAEEILRDADTALYDAKNSGRGGCRLFDPQMHAAAMKRLSMESELRRAIERDELCLLYQPVQSLEGGDLMEVEALLRWEHPKRGMICPCDFISLAEETGLILPLGRWVLRKACRQLRVWQTQLPQLRELTVAVNVSGRQFARGVLPADVAAALAESGLHARNLKLEITETAIMNNGDPALAELNAIRDMGVQFHLDDFGTGYSSLGYLRRMPIEALKIDRSYISAVSIDHTGASIVQAILTLASALGLKVVAEGVEDQSQAEFLRNLGCDFAQGYYFAGPLTPEQFVRFATRVPGPENGATIAAA